VRKEKSFQTVGSCKVSCS